MHGDVAVQEQSRRGSVVGDAAEDTGAALADWTAVRSPVLCPCRQAGSAGLGFAANHLRAQRKDFHGTWVHWAAAAAASRAHTGKNLC
jgi:hypothetical protein